MDLMLSYELFDAEGNSRRGGVASVRQPDGALLLSDLPSPSEPGVRYEPESTYHVDLTDGRFIRVFWNAALFGQQLDVDSIMRGPCVLATVDAFGRHELTVRSEPTVDNRLGVTVSNPSGKVLLLGMGDIIEDEQGNHLVAQGRETFQWRKASPSSCAHTNYAVKNGGTLPK